MDDVPDAAAEAEVAETEEEIDDDDDDDENEAVADIESADDCELWCMLRPPPTVDVDVDSEAVSAAEPVSGVVERLPEGLVAELGTGDTDPVAMAMLPPPPIPIDDIWRDMAVPVLLLPPAAETDGDTAGDVAAAGEVAEVDRMLLPLLPPLPPLCAMLAPARMFGVGGWGGMDMPCLNSCEKLHLSPFWQCPLW